MSWRSLRVEVIFYLFIYSPWRSLRVEAIFYLFYFSPWRSLRVKAIFYLFYFSPWRSLRVEAIVYSKYFFSLTILTYRLLCLLRGWARHLIPWKSTLLVLVLGIGIGIGLGLGLGIRFTENRPCRIPVLDILGTGWPSRGSNDGDILGTNLLEIKVRKISRPYTKNFVWLKKPWTIGSIHIGWSPRIRVRVRVT